MSVPEDLEMNAAEEVACASEEDLVNTVRMMDLNPSDQSGKSEQERGKQSIDKCIENLLHACQCRDRHCSPPSCQKMKRVIEHTKTCKLKKNGVSPCPICKQLIALCCYHAKVCTDSKCPVPHCHNIRHKLKQQQLQQQLQQAHMMRRRMAVMNSVGGSSCAGAVSSLSVPEDLGMNAAEEIDCPSKEDLVNMVRMMDLNPTDQPGKSEQEARKQSIEKLIERLMHACQCRDRHCSPPSCQKLKRVIEHTKTCKRKNKGVCPVCKQLIALCCYHAKVCTDSKCPVPFCRNIRHKLMQQRVLQQQRWYLQELLQQQQLPQQQLPQQQLPQQLPQQQPQQQQLPQQLQIAQIIRRQMDIIKSLGGSSGAGAAENKKSN